MYFLVSTIVAEKQKFVLKYISKTIYECIAIYNYTLNCNYM